jgi:S-adenosyl-L-methionine hydrolase (adenosine-forming)
MAADRRPSAHVARIAHKLACVPMTAVITFLSDYGGDDEFVGVCHGVMARIAPDARVLDVTHGIDRHDVRSGALVLSRALPYFPPGVHLAVVDPEVGGERRAVAVRTAEDQRILVGPDNGLLALAIDRFGGAVEAVDVARSPHRLEPTSATFHGRDLFAPVAAQLAAGAALAEAGDPIDADELTPLHMPSSRRDDDGGLVAHALAFDRFGNVMLDVEHAELAGSGLKLGHRVTINDELAHYATTFADVPPGELLLYEDAYRTLALAVNRGSAALHLGLDLDAEVHIRPA